MTQMLRVLGDLDPSFAWNGERMFDTSEFGPDSEMPRGLCGAFASVQSGPSGAWRISRDPLGINKLFWTRDQKGTILLATRPYRLVEGGHSLEEVRAIPPGNVVDLHPDGSTEEGSLVPESWFSETTPAETAEIAASIRGKLDRYLADLAAAYPSSRAFVCLSGGLDSTGVAALVRAHFRDTVAVSFDLRRPGAAASDDRRVAARLAAELELPLLESNATEDEILRMLDTVLLEGVDWRDFNVHAALVNAAIARDIREAQGTSEPLVFTGDLANEFLADYESESYRGVTYYRLPRLSPTALRDNLVRGLDTSYREVGVFAAYGLPVVQPYAVAVDDYMRLGDEFLGSESRKQSLCRLIFGDLIPEYVFSRTKVRAQVGNEETGGGILAACVDRGYDSAWLQGRFAELHGLENPARLNKFIRAGRYAAAVPATETSSSKRGA